ncbi:MAG: LamB/YcsF family protein [Bacillota bacterium]
MGLTVDLNSDLGEGYGIYTLGLDGPILDVVTSVSVACGLHAGDPLVMEATVKAATTRGLGIGAHPGYPDLQGFGRRQMALSPGEARSFVVYQIGALEAFVRAYGGRLQHVKPHGAMYNMAARDYRLARAIAEGIRSVDSSLILLALANSEMIRAGRDAGLRVAGEVFADRAYNADGSLVSRGTPGAIIEDPDIAVSRVVRMVTEGRVTAIDGTDIPIKVDSVCVHGDSPGAPALIKGLRKSMEEYGVSLAPLASFLGRG